MTMFTKASRLRFAPFALLALAGPALASGGEPLSGAALGEFMGGKRVYLAVPLAWRCGGEPPPPCRRNGVVDGSGEAAGLGRYMTPKDQGRWWVSGSKVCQKWKEWYDGRTFCFTVKKLPGNRLFWERDDGKSGVARVR